MKNKNPEKRNDLLIKIFLFFLFLSLWQRIVMKPMTDRNNENKKQQVSDFTKIAEIGEEKGITSGESVALENDFLKLTLNTRGLPLNNLELKKYQKSVKDKSLVRLLTDDKDKQYYIRNVWVAFNKEDEMPNEDTVWTMDKDNSSKDKLTFKYKNKQNIVFTAQFSFDEQYLLVIKHDVENKSDKNIQLKPVLEIVKQDVFNREEGGTYSGGIGVFEKNEVKEIKNSKLKKRNIEYDKFKWAGFTGKYWLTAVINKDAENGMVNFLKDDKNIKMQYAVKNIILAPNERATHKTELFLGAKDKKTLEEYEKNSGLVLFSRSIDYGMFFFLTIPMTIMLNLLFSIVRDFGLSIILLTLIVKLLLYPMVKKTTVSMAGIKALQPKLKEIQQKHKEDKQTLQREIMKLYRSHNINPLGSLTPLIIQIPIFFSLYKVLSISLEMRQANFFSLVEDLSVADPSNILNLFGLLPFDTSFNIGVLPSLMALTMFIQQKTMNALQGKANESEEMKMANNINKWLPLILLFTFSGLPAGLLLYWIMNNIISIAQQFYIEKKYLA